MPWARPPPALLRRGQQPDPPARRCEHKESEAGQHAWPDLPTPLLLEVVRVPLAGSYVHYGRVYCGYTTMIFVRVLWPYVLCACVAIRTMTYASPQLRYIRELYSTRR